MMLDGLIIFIRWLPWLITIVFRCVQDIIPKVIEPIHRNDYDMSGSEYDDVNVPLQMMYKTPVAIS